MDNLLKGVNQDLKFTAYKVLAHSISDGMLEFVPNCKTIQDILEDHKGKAGIADWFKKVANGDEARYAQIYDNYLKSCAGYAVVTYFLAVGDRHLENLLID